MPRQRVITQEKFDDLLSWLDPEREQAGTKYEEIRRSLIRIFAWRGCRDAEGLADRVINIVADKVGELKGNYEGDPAVYFYAVANMIVKECQREAQAQVPLGDFDIPANAPPLILEDGEENSEQEYECLLKCLETLTPDKRTLILSYYREEKQAKIDHRKELASQYGIDPNALRVRAHRIRAALEKCIESCLEEAAADEMN